MARLRVLIELEGTRLRVLFCRGRGAKARVERARVYSLVDSSPERLTSALREACDGLDVAGSQVALLLSDRRIVPGTLELVRKPQRAELSNRLYVEAARIGMFPEDEELLVGYLDVPSPAGWRCFFEVAPRSFIEEVVGAVRAVGFEEICVASVEATLASGLSAEMGRAAGTVALLEVHGDRARLVLCRGRQVLAARKVKLAFGFEPGQDIMDVLLPLSFEVIRSLEFFEGQGHARPEKMFLLADVDRDSFDASLWQETFDTEVSLIRPPALDLVPDELTEVAAWIAPALSAHTGPTAACNWLIAPRMRSWRRAAGVAVLQLAGLAAMVGGIWLLRVGLGEEAKSARRLLRKMRSEVTTLQQAQVELESRHDVPAIVAARAKLLASIDDRRVSLSRLCARLGNERPKPLKFARILVRDGSDVAIEGVIDTEDRLAAVRHFGALDTLVKTELGDVPSGGKAEADRAKGGRVPFRYWAGASPR